MAMFDYHNLTGEKAAEVIATAHQLSGYTNVRTIVGNNVLSDIADDLFTSGLVSASRGGSTDLPDGWKLLSAHELGIDPKYVDSRGFFTAKSPVLGVVVPGGIQAQVMAEYDEGGNISRLALVWSGTSSPVDIIDYFKLLDKSTLESLTYLAEKTADFARANGVAAEDMIVTGYSLGGANAAIMSEAQETLAGGYYNGAQFISLSGPLTSTADNFINVGYENDIVFRAAGNYTDFGEALKAAGPLLEGSDFDVPNATSNVILFDGAYASPLFPFGPFSILNIPGGWYAHIDGVFTDAIERISGSVFYDLTERQSTVVVSNLGADLRSHTWVYDKSSSATTDHFGKSALLIGTVYGDKMHDGKANDYFDLSSGNDLARVSTGYDVIDGGAGHDIVRVQGYAKDWNAYRLSDGTLMLDSKYGLKSATNVEEIQFEELSIGVNSTFNKSYAVTDHKLDFKGGWLASMFNDDVHYGHHVEGTSGKDSLSGKVVFGLDGNDVIKGTGSDDLLHGGRGQDVIFGGDGDDRLYGAEHDDFLVASNGNDKLNGGHGDDVFVFNEGLSGHVVVEDFNRATDQDDVLLFKGHLSSVEEVRHHAHQSGSDVVIECGHLQITLQDTQLSDLTDTTLSFA